MAKTAVDVLVFDSGVGGLSILRAIREQAPELSYAFLGDNAGLPYGDKSEAWLLDRVPQAIAALLQKLECKALVIACNTASTIVLPPLREQYSFPVIGVVPAIKPAAALSRSKRIGLLATPATIARPYTETLIRDFAADCQVIRVGSSRLVAMAEEKLRGGSIDGEELSKILKPFAEAKPDVVVLGCTHFPLLRDELELALPDISWIDSGDAIAKRVMHFHLKADGTPPAPGRAYFTQDDISIYELRAFGLSELQVLSLPI